MKGLTSIVVAGALALGIAGCKTYVGSANGYSCERNLSTISATKGEKEAVFVDSETKEIQYKNMARDEALNAIDGCLDAFKKLGYGKK